MKIRIDMTGVRYGRLVGVEFAYRKGGHAHWLFECDCGNETIAAGASVRVGNTRSCGCLQREVCAARLTTHGYRAGKRHDATYRAWQMMNDCCTNARSPRFRDFGARGIDVCCEWRADFTRFLGDMGERPEGTILSRIDQRVNFGPANCRWRPRAANAGGEAQASIRDARRP